MEFRPCIDIHDGYVKQIVGSSLDDKGFVKENFVSDRNSSFYANLYKEHNLKGGHVIILNKIGTPEYESSKKTAFEAFSCYQNGLQVGGGITLFNAEEFIEAGASHVIVTSFLFEDDRLSEERMDKLSKLVGKEKVVFDLSCKKTEKGYFIATNRWQTLTDTCLDVSLLKKLEKYCDEYLIHAVDVEGKCEGPEVNLLEELSKYEGNPITYAGGIHSFEDIETIEKKGRGKINFTIGSALDIFGGNLSFEKVVEKAK